MLNPIVIVALLSSYLLSLNAYATEPKAQDKRNVSQITVEQMDNCPVNLSLIDTQAELDIIGINGLSADDFSPALFDDRFCMYSLWTPPSELANYTTNPNKNIHFSKNIDDYYAVKARYEEVFKQYNSIEEQAALTRVFLNRLTKEFAVSPSYNENIDGLIVSVKYRSPKNGEFSAEALYLLGTESPELVKEFERQVLQVSRRAATPQIHVDIAYIFNGIKAENTLVRYDETFVNALKSQVN